MKVTFGSKGNDIPKGGKRTKSLSSHPLTLKRKILSEEESYDYSFSIEPKDENHPTLQSFKKMSEKPLKIFWHHNTEELSNQIDISQRKYIYLSTKYDEWKVGLKAFVQRLSTRINSMNKAMVPNIQRCYKTLICLPEYKSYNAVLDTQNKENHSNQLFTDEIEIPKLSSEIDSQGMFNLKKRNEPIFKPRLFESAPNLHESKDSQNFEIKDQNGLEIQDKCDESVLDIDS